MERSDCNSCDRVIVELWKLAIIRFASFDGRGVLSLQGERAS
jgi:hypothetical protein